MKKPWFERKGRFYKPITPLGWLVSASLLVVLIFLIATKLLQHNELSITLTDISLYTIATATVYALIAYLTQK